MRRRLLLLVVALSLAACGGGPAADAPTAATESPTAAGTDAPALDGELVVFAAASLTDAFSELGGELMAEHPELEVVFNFAGSAQLATQLTEGGPASVFASADATQMAAVIDADLVEGEPQGFAENLLSIVVEAGNPEGVAELADLTDELVVVLAAEEVPVGRYSREALADAGVEVNPDSLEPDVRSVLARVELGEADAGIVYTSDVVAAGDAVTGVEIPADVNVVASYPIAVLTEAPNPDAAQAFVDLVLSDRGREVLESFGFATP